MVNNPHEQSSSSDEFIVTDIEKQKGDYLTWARSRVLVLSHREFLVWQIEKIGEITEHATGLFVNAYNPDGSVDFDCAINRDAFTIDGINYQDLIPYAIEHEIQESLAKIRIRHEVMAPIETQSIGMEKEYEMAARDHKEDRLYEYMARIAPDRRMEYQEAYDRVKNRTTKNHQNT